MFASWNVFLFNFIPGVDCKLFSIDGLNCRIQEQLSKRVDCISILSDHNNSLKDNLRDCFKYAGVFCIIIQEVTKPSFHFPTNAAHNSKGWSSRKLGYYFIFTGTVHGLCFVCWSFILSILQGQSIIFTRSQINGWSPVDCIIFQYFLYS